MQVHLFSVPYDSGHRSRRTGAGPEHVLRGGLVTALGEDGHAVRVDTIEAPAPMFPAEIATAFALNSALAGRVRTAIAEGEFPIVLAGNCNATLGTVAGVGAEDTGLLWFDAHGDFNTPETTLGGFLDGMGLATVVGRCWSQLSDQVPGFAPLEERNVFLLAVRDLDPLEARLLADSEVTVMPPSRVRAELVPALDRLRTRARHVHLHIDLDSLDPSEGVANALHAKGGLGVEEMHGIIRLVSERLPIAAATFSSYDPSYDPDGRIRDAVIVMIRALLDSVAARDRA